MKRIITAIIAFIMLLSVAGCESISGTEDSFEGLWIRSSGNIDMMTFELNGDGTGTCRYFTASAWESGLPVDMTYKVDGDKFIVTLDENERYASYMSMTVEEYLEYLEQEGKENYAFRTITYTYSMNGDELTLTQDGTERPLTGNMKKVSYQEKTKTETTAPEFVGRWSSSDCSYQFEADGSCSITKGFETSGGTLAYLTIDGMRYTVEDNTVIIVIDYMESVFGLPADYLVEEGVITEEQCERMKRTLVFDYVIKDDDLELTFNAKLTLPDKSDEEIAELCNGKYHSDIYSNNYYTKPTEFVKKNIESYPSDILGKWECKADGETFTFVFEDIKTGYAFFDGIKFNMNYVLSEDKLEITLDSIDYYEAKYGMPIEDVLNQGLISESELYFIFSGNVTIKGDKMIFDIDTGYTREFTKK